ncbi:hypothetical protein CULT_510015 [[Clostridium] ultunense Esp]|nr:hypothetical protein CULT_510015 [[Clostridium] ultunense Esp]
MNHPQTGLAGKDYEGYCKEIMSTLPEISALSDEIETKGLIPDEILQWMYEMKIFKFFVPIELGGKMAPLPAALRVYEALAAVDGNIGWLAQIGAGGGYFVPSFTHEVAKEFFSNPRAVIAGTGYPAGKHVPFREVIGSKDIGNMPAAPSTLPSIPPMRFSSMKGKIPLPTRFAHSPFIRTKFASLRIGNLSA